MGEIPINFEYKGKRYSGVFTEVTGGGSSATWRLLINKLYQGQLFQYEDWPAGLPMDPARRSEIELKWRFASQTGEFAELADFFGDYLTAWYG